MIRWCYAPVLSSQAVPCENWKSTVRRCIPIQHRVQPVGWNNSPPIVAVIDDSTQTDKRAPPANQTMSKQAQKRALKQQMYEAKKAEKKAVMTENKKREAERKRRQWQEKLASVGEEEREKMIEERRGVRKEHMKQLYEEREMKIRKLQEGRINGQNLVIDLEFYPLMSSSQLHSLVQQIMCCYSMNGRCASPARIWLTGCNGGMEDLLVQITGYDKWIIDKEPRSYLEVFQDQKENLVYLTADSEHVLEDVDPNTIYIIAGLVDRNRMKGITAMKAKEQGIKTAKLPIATYMKMSASQVLTVNQVVEILLKFLETRDWNASFFQVIPQRKRFEAASDYSNTTLRAEGYF